MGAGFQVRAISFVVTMLLGLLTVGLPAQALAAQTGDALPGSASASNSPGGPAAKSDRQISLGVSMLHYTDLSLLKTFTAEMGGPSHRPAIWSVWSDWKGPNAEFPTALMDQVASLGVLPMVFWEPADPLHTNEPVITYAKIIAGDFDAYIHQWARAAAAYGKPMILRFAHEMDGKWFPWSIGRFPGNSPTQFINAWRHIWNIFKGPNGEGAVNVRFLWSPFTPGAWMAKRGSGIYPGDAYVDYVGFTGLNWNDTGRPWASMAEIYGRLVDALRLISHRPIIVAETGTVNKVSNGHSLKPGWIANGYPAIFQRFPSVIAIVYFNINMGFQADWRLDEPADALEAYRKIANDPRFEGRLTWDPPNPPVATAPVVSLLRNSRAKSERVRVDWNGYGGTPIASYEVQLQTDGQWSAVALKSPSVADTAASLAESHHYAFRVRARDVNGRTSPWAVSKHFTIASAQETSSAVDLHGHFTEAHLSGAFGKHVEWSSRKRDTATFTFVGSSVGFVSTYGPNRGEANVYLDGKLIHTINLYAKRDKPGQVVFATSSAAGQHTLTVKVLGKGKGSGARNRRGRLPGPPVAWRACTRAQPPRGRPLARPSTFHE